MSDPVARRPHMPGYGIVGHGEGSGLLPWAWAEERLITSRNYWVATVWPDGRPHVMPVWAVWQDRSLWFTSSLASRKTRNLLANPNCVMTTDDAPNPVVIEGHAALRQEPELTSKFLNATNAKYGTSYGMELVDPAVNATFRLEPNWAFGLMQDDFTGSPTCWEFG